MPAWMSYRKKPSNQPTIYFRTKTVTKTPPTKKV